MKLFEIRMIYGIYHSELKKNSGNIDRKLTFCNDTVSVASSNVA